MVKNNCSMVAERRGEELWIGIQGEIDHHNASRIRRDIDMHIAEALPRRMMLDLSSIDFMDSSGLGLIMGRYERMRQLGGELVLWHPNESVLKIFRLAGLQRIIRIEEKKNEK